MDVDAKAELSLTNLKLCRLVKTFNCIWDQTDPNYMKLAVADEAWKNIAINANDSVTSCKERWRNIRAAFARSINLYKTHKRKQRKRYYLHDELLFLKKEMRRARNLSPTESDDDDDDGDDDKTSNYDVNDNADIDIGDYGQNVTNRETSVSDSYPHSETPVTEKSVIQRQLLQTQEILPQFKNESTSTPPTPPPPAKIPKIITQELPLSTPLTPRDSDVKFLSVLLPELKAMNSRQKIIFKRKIYQALEEVFDNPADFPKSTTAVKKSKSTASADTTQMNSSTLNEAGLTTDLIDFNLSSRSIQEKSPIKQISQLRLKSSIGRRIPQVSTTQSAYSDRNPSFEANVFPDRQMTLDILKCEIDSENDEGDDNA